MAPLFKRLALRPLGFVAGSCTLSLAPFVLGMTLWPEGLNPIAANFLWPASGFNLALVHKWGWRYAPLIWLNGVAAVLLLGQPVALSAAGSSMNILEALAGSWLLTRLAGGFAGPFRSRSILVLCAISVLMGILVALPLAGVLVKVEGVPSSLYWSIVSSNVPGNACGVLFVTPALLTFPGWKELKTVFTKSFFIGGLILSIICLPAINGVFQGRFNYAFAVFPVMTFFAVRYTFSQICWFVLWMLGLIYTSLVLNGHSLPMDRTPEILWFVQAYSWVLAATTLGMSVLIEENRQHALRSLQRENDLLESQLRGNRAELQALRYQINPHFLHNSLNSICAVVDEDAFKARNMITRLSTFFRATLESPAGDRVPLETAFKNVMLYLDIEKTRYEDSLTIELDVDPDLRSQSIPVFLLQPLVENAIQHGFMQERGIFELRICARKSTIDRFVVEVDHPGHWRETPDETRNGVGLENIRNRLRLLYGDRAGLETQLDSNRVCQRLYFPLEAS